MRDPAVAGPDRRGPAEKGLTVSVAALARAPGSGRHEVRAGPIDELAALSVAVPEDSPVEVDVTLSSFPGGIMASGTVGAPWRGECRRCGGEVTGRVVAEVRERFVTERAGDEEAYPLEDDRIDLEPMARDAVLLELPLAPLCAEDCRGLCPECGTNWNLATCSCTGRTDPRWSVLDRLREP